MKRFYRQATAEHDAEGWHVALDGRRVKSQGGRALVLPRRAMAEALASEWASQGETLDPRAFPMRDLADLACDVIAEDRDTVVTGLLRYAETDTLCYRADPDAPLWPRQQALWEPLLAAAEARENIRLRRVSGVMHRPQDPAAIAVLRARLEAFDHFTLAALNTLASLAASLTIALAALEPDADGDALWDAANLEEDWQAEFWGRDSQAAERRAQRKAIFLTAMAFARASASPTD